MIHTNRNHEVSMSRDSGVRHQVRVRWVYSLLLLSLLSVSVRAQPVVADGSRVRLVFRLVNREPMVGVVRHADMRTITLGLAPDSTVRTDELRRVDVSAGQSSHRWRGAAIGGAITSAAFVSMACAMSNGSCDIRQDVGGFLAYAATGAIPGVLIGGAIGSHFAGNERWRAVWTRDDLLLADARTREDFSARK